MNFSVTDKRVLGQKHISCANGGNLKKKSKYKTSIVYEDNKIDVFGQLRNINIWIARIFCD